MVVSEVFRDPAPDVALAGQATLLEALQAGIAENLAVLDDPAVTGTGQSSAGVLGVSGGVLAETLAGHLVREIMFRGSRGGPLTPLAGQLNHDVTHLQGQRLEGMLAQLVDQVEARASGVEPATPAELHRDLITLLRGLDEQARTGRLPPYLPAGADVTVLSRTVRVRPEVRTGPAGYPGDDDRGGQGGGLYRLPVERPQDSEPPLPWPQVAGKHRRLVVLADPGLGKSWLVRTETQRLCEGGAGRPGGRAGAGGDPGPAAV